MAKITRVNSDSFMREKYKSLIFPVPGRIRGKGFDEYLIPAVKESFKLFNNSKEKYMEASSNKAHLSPGEIHIFRDVNLHALDIQNQDKPVENIIEEMQENSVLIVFLPIKTREDKSIAPHVYLSSFRALANLIKNNDEEVLEQFSTMAIPEFPGIIDSLEKVNEIFRDIDTEIFVCVDSN